MKRRKDVEFPLMWGFAAGGLDEDDNNPKITAIREFREETGYNGKIIISKEVLLREKTNHLDFYLYLCMVPGEFKPNLSGECECGLEHLEYAWFDLDVLDENLMVPTVVSSIKNNKNIINKSIEFGKSHFLKEK